MAKKSLKQIRKIVKSVLIADEKARSSDSYLYIQVVKRLSPCLAEEPLEVAFMSVDLPNYESVRRNRQWLQAKFPELCGDEETEAWRIVQEQTYHDTFGGVTE